ncbi:hypothetical protein ABVK25_007012 [Lepraria finkii]|uniref:Uncharacterized protein n=1 Tax=Lepraria finkii TaxID=1340010 RepID=A0ABR4B622_9LECA
MHALTPLIFFLLLRADPTLTGPTPTTFIDATNKLTNSSYLQISTNLTIISLPFEPPADAYKFKVPYTLTTLYLHLGFKLDTSAVTSTVGAAQDFVQDHVEEGSKGALDPSNDPFEEDLGYGAKIRVVSVRPDNRMTWEILQDTMQGLWNFLVVDRHHVEADFEITTWAFGEQLVGRGSIEASSVYSPPSSSFSSSSAAQQKRRRLDKRLDLDETT